MDFVQRKNCRLYLDIVQAVAANPEKHTVGDVLMSLSDSTFEDFDDDTPDQDMKDADAEASDEDGDSLSAEAIKRQYMGFAWGPVDVLDLLGSEEWDDHLDSISKPSPEWQSCNHGWGFPQVRLEIHQCLALGKLFEMAGGLFQGGFLAHGPGMGKTMSALCAAFRYRRRLVAEGKMPSFILYATAEESLEAAYAEVQKNTKPVEEYLQDRFSAIIVRSLDITWEDLEGCNVVIVSHTLLIESWNKVNQGIELLDSVRSKGVTATMEGMSREQLNKPKSSLVSILHNMAWSKHACFIIDRWPFGPTESDFTLAAQAIDSHSTFLVSDRLLSQANDWRDLYNQISVLPVQHFADKAHFEAMFDTRDRGDGAVGIQLLACLLDGLVITCDETPFPALIRQRVTVGHDVELGDRVEELALDALSKRAMGLVSRLKFHASCLSEGGRLLYDYAHSRIAPVCTEYGGDYDGPGVSDLSTTTQAVLEDQKVRIAQFPIFDTWVDIVKSATDAEIKTPRASAVLEQIEQIWKSTPRERIVVLTRLQFEQDLVAEAIYREARHNPVFDVEIGKFVGPHVEKPHNCLDRPAELRDPRILLSCVFDAQDWRYFTDIKHVIMCNPLPSKCEDDRVLAFVRHIGSTVDAVTVYDLFAPESHHDRGFYSCYTETEHQDMIVRMLLAGYDPTGMVKPRPVPDREALGFQ